MQSCGCFEKFLNEKKEQNVRQQFEIGLIQWFFTGGTPPQGVLINFQDGISPFHALQHGIFLTGKCCIQTLRLCWFYIVTSYWA